MVDLRGVWLSVKPFLTFSAPKTVTIRDWRLGSALRVLQIVIVVYVLVQIFQQQGYLETEVPAGVVTPFARGGNLTTQDLNKELQAGQLPYCTNPNQYRFYYDPSTTYENLSCVYQPTGANAIKGYNSMFYTTYIAEQKSVLVRRPTQADCPAGDDVLPGAALQGYLADVCMYKRKRSFLTMAVENALLRVNHVYSTSLVGVQGSLPRTIVRRRGSAANLMELPANTALQMPVQQWLNLAGIDLDLPTNQQPGVKHPTDPLLMGSSYSAGKYPMVRVSGVEIVVNLKYYNYKLAPGRYKAGMCGCMHTRTYCCWTVAGGTCGTPEGNVATQQEPVRQSASMPTCRMDHVSGKNQVICIMELDANLQWTTTGSDVRYAMPTAKDPVLLAINQNSVVPGSNTTFTFVKEAFSNESANVVTSSTDMYKQGIMFTFKPSGALGRFSIQKLINALVQGSVLLSVAHVLVTLIALYGCGLRSQLYGEFMAEKVEFKREYARFASQALVAAHIFKKLDKDGSGELDRAELFVQLKDIMGKRLADDKLAVLCEFLCNTADEDDVKPQQDGPTGPNGVVYNENAINLDEWLHVFTDEKVSVESLVRIVNAECKKDPEIDRAMKLERIKAKSDTQQSRLSGNKDKPDDQGDTKGGGQGESAPRQFSLEASSTVYAV